jgi:hypothetical protein
MIKKWLTADGEKDFLDSEEFEEFFNEFKEVLAANGVIVKQFADDPNDPHQ